MDCRHTIDRNVIGSPYASCVGKTTTIIRGGLFSPQNILASWNMPMTKDEQQTAWHALEVTEVLRDLQVHENGLTAKEASARLRRYGLNQLQEARRPGFWIILWEQLNNFVVILLIVSSLVSALLGEWVDALAILAIVILNTVLGIVQERRAEQALAALKQLAAPEAHILRDGHRQVIPARDLVPGDMVFLEAGNYVPADVRLLEAVNLRIEEASLTGESLPVEKNAAAVLNKSVPLGDRQNMAFMGTLVSYGRGRGVVVSTGMRTQLGLIASLLQNVEAEETPLQRRLDQLGQTLSIGALILVAVVFILELMDATHIFSLFSSPLIYLQTYAKEITNVFIIAVSLAIAAVPEGLPAVVTISLALGMREMIQRHALIRKLASVETLGSATVICSDKTGTLTQNEMTVTRLWVDNQTIEITGEGYSSKGNFLANGKKIQWNKYRAVRTVLWLSILNNDAQIEPVKGSKHSYRVVGDPTEAALLVAAAKAGEAYLVVDRERTAYPRIDEIPFDSERKHMVTFHLVEHPKANDFSHYHDDSMRGRNLIAIKGAPEVVLPLCKYYQTMDDTSHRLSQTVLEKIYQANDAMTRDALRVIALAYRDVKKKKVKLETLGNDLVFAGLVGMMDPARNEVKPAIQTARHAGIGTIMITGDYPNTARAIASQIGLMHHEDKVLTGADLDRLSDTQLSTAIGNTFVFARVSPQHKLRIVDALQANGEVVAMTGDGVNDAPAIKRADIGIAMGITGTDVAKETADMVLTDDNYASIVSAIEQGRIIYNNIRKFVFFLLSSNVAEIMVIFLTALAGLPAPLTAIQLLWLNLITDGAPALALAMEKGDPDIMSRKPRSKTEPIINRTMAIGIAIQTIAQTGAVLFAFVLGLMWHLQANAQIPAGMNPLIYLLHYNWRGVDIQTAETMAFVTLSLCELFRAYTVRSERASVFQIGIFSNVYMQLAVGSSIALLLAVCAVPFLQIVFNTHFLSWNEWLIVLGLSLIPAISEEITKLFLRMKS
jgi:Ca2+-transporting ATPase